MAQIWTEMPTTKRDRGGARPRWGVVSLDATDGALALTGDPARPVARRTDESLERHPAYILRHHGQAGGVKWILYASPEASLAVNGQAMALGLRSLRDRDEIRLGRSCHLVFSAESLPKVEAFPGIGAEAICPRCQEPIEPGRPAVRCPHCGVWHHQDEQIDRLCWTYDTKCAVDGRQVTALDGTLRWTPEGLQL